MIPTGGRTQRQGTTGHLARPRAPLLTSKQDRTLAGPWMMLTMRFSSLTNCTRTVCSREADQLGIPSCQHHHATPDLQPEPLTADRHGRGVSGARGLALGCNRRHPGLRRPSCLPRQGPCHCGSERRQQGKWAVERRTACSRFAQIPQFPFLMRDWTPRLHSPWSASSA